MSVASTHTSVEPEGTLQCCHRWSGCRGTEKLSKAATAQCSICYHCNTTSSIHTYCNSWGREVETIRCWDMSEIHKNRSLRMRSWPNTRINLSLSWQCLNFSDTPPQTSGLPALTLRGEKEEEKIHGEVKSEKIIKCMPALTLVFFCTQ